MRIWRRATKTCGLAVIALALGTGGVLAGEAATPEELEAGKFIYTRACANCHGPQGKGDGLAAPLLDPRPRDFTPGVFKFRSTPSGMVPTLDDLGRTVTHGLNGTAMGQWRELSDKDRRAVLLYVQTFSDNFRTQSPAPIPIPPEPSFSLESAQRGAKLYAELKCEKCHGPEGRGDGPSAAELKDRWERPIRPTDLTQGHRFKRGSTPQDIYLTMFTGLMGTPMPSYGENTLENAEQEWDLVYYVYALSQGKPISAR